MKILMINHFPLAGSGSGTYTRNLAVHLSTLGHDVRIILPENSPDYDTPPGVRLRPVFFTPDEGTDPSLYPKKPLPFNFPCFTSHPRSVTTFGDLDEDQLKQYREAFRKAVLEEISNDRPDVIHGQHVWILPALAADTGIPLVLTAHGTDLMGYDRWPAFREAARTAMNACSAVISISKDNCTLLEERFPEHRDKIVMMRNGYDPEVFRPLTLTREEVLGPYGITPEEYTGRKIVSFAGKLAHFKGVDVLLEAVKRYETADPASVTLIIGDGDERSTLRRQAESLSLKTVRFLGSVSQQELCRLYSIADVNIVPSRREPFGLVAIEAMACGTPVIASDQGGLPDFVNDSVGALVRPEDPEDLALHITEILQRSGNGDYPGWRRSIAEYAHTHYAQDTIIKELDSLYHRVCR